MSDKSVGEVESPRGGEVERIGVRYGFFGGGRADSAPPPKRAMEYWNAIGGVDLLSVPPPYHAME